MLKSHHAIIAVIVCSIAMAHAQSKVAPTWADEFAGQGLPDRNKWVFEQGFQRNQELQYYQNNAWQEKGELIVEARREKVANPKFNPRGKQWYQQRQFAEYTSASVRTAGKYYFQYGRMQVRAKIPCVPGAWPAIWTLGKKGEWPSNGECDILEYYKPDIILANTLKATKTPYNAAWDAVKLPVSKHFANVDPQWRDQYHVWTMQWDQDNVRLYVDSVLLNDTPQSWLVNPTTQWGPKEPFKQPHEILLNLAIGANGGDPSKTNFPLRYHIDYVRVWERYTKNAAPTNIGISQKNVREGLPAGTLVGNLAVIDDDPAEVVSYALVNGAGATHNDSFSISFLSGETRMSALKTAKPLKHADGSTRSIRVRATDIVGATFEKALTITIDLAAQ